MSVDAASVQSRSTIGPNDSAAAADDPLAARYLQVRRFSERLCEPLATEDYIIQSMADASPARWHLAHTSWFFETFLLAPLVADYRSPHPQYNYLFNSYYQSIGPQHCRPRRGVISRPTVAEVYQYRKHVDEQMVRLLESDDPRLAEAAPLVKLGLNHEQQHQELILTDIKHAFASNPLYPAYHERPLIRGGDPGSMAWLAFDEGLHWMGHDGGGFAFDNESPRHRVFLEPFELGTRLVTVGEFLAFMEDGGYEQPRWWLSAGWNTVQENRWEAPLYWEKRDGRWWTMTLAGLREINPAEPVCHISYYEADAYARWAGARLPTEAEWEAASQDQPVDGNFAESSLLHPVALDGLSDRAAVQMFGDVWEWTASAYAPYPGYRPAAGALGEYNGKFMCGQQVLRGGSCATPRSHVRRTYRNFFAPQTRWQFSGLRLARSV